MGKQNLLICPLFIMGVFLLFAGGCTKEDDNKNGNTAGLPVLTTIEVSGITQTAAVSGGDITSDGGAEITARGVCWSTGQTPTISNNKTTDGTGIGVFSSSLSGLSPGTTYYVRSYAINGKGTGYGNVISFTTKPGGSAGDFTDSRDGTVYPTVIIGNQIWMARNLRYLPSVTGSSSGSRTTPMYYVNGYNGTDVSAAKASSNYSIYGVLYNWPAVMAGAPSSSTNPSGVQGVCPTGWHMPSEEEWNELIDYLGGKQDAGGKLKATTLWTSPNTGATNETGFSALPGSSRTDIGVLGPGGYGYWWSTTEAAAVDYALNVWLGFATSSVYINNQDKSFGLSVRCVKN